MSWKITVSIWRAAAVAVLVTCALFAFPADSASASGNSPSRPSASNLKAASLVSGTPVSEPDDASDSTTSDDDGSAADVARAKALIDALPYDPYQVQLSDAQAITRALEAFEGLTQEERDQLDVAEAGNGVLSYGRTLECAAWGLYALAATDDATGLADGTYTTQFTSTCNMGKSTSSRGYKFTVTKVEVRDGHAKATLEHGTASPDTLMSGGVTYPHVNGDESAKSTFEIPVNLNSTFYVAQMGKNRTANTFAIPYEMRVDIDEAAVPDAPGDEGAGAAGSAGAGDAGDAGGADDADGAGGAGGAGGAEDAGSAGGAGASRTLVGKAAPAAGAAKKPVGADAMRQAESASDEDGASEGGRRSKGANATGEADRGNAVQILADDDASGAETSAADYGSRVAAVFLALLVAGIGAFFVDYRRRDSRPVRISGVGLSGERA